MPRSADAMPRSRCRHAIFIIFIFTPFHYFFHFIFHYAELLRIAAIIDPSLITPLLIASIIDYFHYLRHIEAELMLASITPLFSPCFRCRASRRHDMRDVTRFSDARFHFARDLRCLPRRHYALFRHYAISLPCR
jgi:hypothetical protein